MREVHAVPSGYHRERHGNRRDHGEPLHHVVLPDINSLLIEAVDLQRIVLQRFKPRGQAVELT